MNVLLFPSLYYPHIGGVEMVVSNLAREFSTLGHTVEIVTSRWPRTLLSADLAEGIKVTRLPFALPATLKSTVTWPVRFSQSYFGFKKLLRSRRWDVVNLHYPAEGAFFAGLCCSAQNIPIVTSIHGSDIELIPNRSRMQRLVTKRLLRSCSAIVANSKSVANSACKLAGSNIQSRLVVVGNAVCRPQSEGDVQRPAGLPARYIVSVGRLVHVKGFDLLVRAFAAIPSAHRDIHLVAVGDGVEKNALQALVAQLGVDNRVHFVGKAPHEAVHGYMRYAEFAVVPSRQEGFGLVALEAMACDKAVVAMPVGGLPEVVSDGQTGLLAAAPTVEALAKSITTLLDRPDYAAELGRNGRRWVDSRHTWASAARKYVEVFQSVLPPRAARISKPLEPKPVIPNAFSPRA